MFGIVLVCFQERLVPHFAVALDLYANLQMREVAFVDKAAFGVNPGCDVLEHATAYAVLW